jgi:hypothetical protein
MSAQVRTGLAWLAGVVAAGACAAVCVGLSHLFTIGTCASGSTPYVIALPCPSGTAAGVGLLGGGLIVLTIASSTAAFLYSGGWKVGYALLFLSLGGTALVSALTRSGLSSGSSSAAWLLAATFLPMGAWPVLAALMSGAEGSESRRLGSRGVTAPATVAAVSTTTRWSTGESLIKVTYRVEPHAGHSFELDRSFSVLPGQMPRVGERVQLRYDPKQPANFQVEAA